MRLARRHVLQNRESQVKIPARFARVWSALVSKADEGQYRAGPYQLPITGGWLSAHAGSFLNWWQLGFDPWGRGGGAVVEACISAYSQTIATCPGDHWRRKENGGRERVTNSALSRILRHPNDYQSMSDFMLNLTRSLYLDGNAYALALRNDRYEIDELHLMDPRMSWPQLAVTGDVFYTLKGNDIIDYRIDEPLIVPARDVLHQGRDAADGSAGRHRGWPSHHSATNAILYESGAALGGALD
jgi:hypothetical protein